MPGIKSFMLLLVFAASTPLLAQQNEPPKLKPVFNDDFSKDTRGEYEIEGEIRWESGTLTLSEGASIKRAIKGGAWAQVELDLGDGGWGAGDEKLELQIRFLLDGATDCYVRLQTSENGQADSVALLDTGKQDGEPITQVVREMPLAKGTLSRITVEYRYGLVAVTADGSLLLTAYIENGTAAVISSAVNAAEGSARLDGWTADSLPAAPSLTEEQQRQAAEATTANEKLILQRGCFCCFDC